MKWPASNRTSRARCSESSCEGGGVILTETSQPRAPEQYSQRWSDVTQLCRRKTVPSDGAKVSFWFADSRTSCSSTAALFSRNRESHLVSQTISFVGLRTQLCNAKTTQKIFVSSRILKKRVCVSRQTASHSNADCPFLLLLLALHAG